MKRKGTNCVGTLSDQGETETTSNLSEYFKAHSQYSEHLVLTPILKSVLSQFSSFVREVINAWHALQNCFLPEIAPKGRNREKITSAKTQSLFSFPHDVREA